MKHKQKNANYDEDKNGCKKKKKSLHDEEGKN